ncbi:glycerophosphodiester phosphodiesterase family protein [Cohnella zeiphila]|uniref:Glycerophosphodiester phosphodiesterase n=1 Tax=Cohnella zeiphila TaxID=2761120 RepID=A0A7X0SNB1_9BACL|nr:glycerophosphodiester phosphodiesterase [Cohnella zeiphila]
MNIHAVAHRGYPVKYPENTLSAYRASLDLNFTYVELDVHLSKDGVPVLMHDFTVNRLTDGTGYIKDFTLEELKRLRVRETEQIPTLEEALALYKGRAMVSIELKQAGDIYPGLEEKVLESVRRAGMLDQVYIISFDTYSVIKTRKLCPDVELGIVMSGCTPFVFEPMKELSIRYLAVPVHALTHAYADECLERGLQLIAWPGDTEEQMQKLLQYPSVLVTTNELERWRDFVIRHPELNGLAPHFKADKI